MFPFEVDYLAGKERCKDFQREAACDQMLHEAGLQAGGWEARKLMAWLGNKLGNRSET